MDILLESVWSRRDMRVDDWLLMSSPLPTLLFSSLYVFAVKILGPWMMKNRAPFDLKTSFIVYKVGQAFFNFWIMKEVYLGGWATTYSYICEPVDKSPSGLRMAKAAWWYFFSKFLDYFDTFFYVARKRYDHVSTLHVFHHSIMPIFTWQACRFIPGGHESFAGLLNTFTRVILFSHQALASTSPAIQPFLFWRKFLVPLQMIQFLTVLGHSTILLFYNPCGFPVIHSIISNAFISLFLLHLYLSSKTKKESPKMDEIVKQE